MVSPSIRAPMVVRYSALALFLSSFSTSCPSAGNQRRRLDAVDVLVGEGDFVVDVEVGVAVSDEDELVFVVAVQADDFGGRHVSVRYRVGRPRGR